MVKKSGYDLIVGLKKTVKGTVWFGLIPYLIAGLTGIVEYDAELAVVLIPLISGLRFIDNYLKNK